MEKDVAKKFNQKEASEQLKTLRDLYKIAVEKLQSDQIGRDKTKNITIGKKEAYDFLKAGGNIEIRNKDKKTLLIIAVENNAVAAVKMLLAKKASVNATDSQGGSALYYAAQKGYAPLTRLLLDYGANPHLKANNGLSPYDIAVGEKHTECVSVIEKFEKEKTKKERISLLMTQTKTNG